MILQQITASSFLIYPPNNATTATYTVSHEKKHYEIYLYLRKKISFTDSKTGVIGIDIKFAKPTAEDYQLLAYAVYPKVALIDNTGDCQVVDNI